MSWRLGRAKWLLGGEAKDRDHNNAEARFLLTDIVKAYPSLAEPRRLLGLAFESAGLLPNALEQLRKAVELDPADASAAFEVARLLQADGRYEEARPYIERMAASEDPQMRLRAADLFARQGQPDRAVALLESSPTTQPAASTDLLRAQLYRQQGKTGEAERIYQRLLQDPSVDAAIIQSAADFYASRKKLEPAREILGRLSALKTRPGEAELIRAEFDDRYVSREAAAEQYLAATRAAPSDPDVWRQFVRFHLRKRDFAAAISAADQGLRAMPDNVDLASLKRQAMALQDNPDASDLLPLVDAMAQDASHPLAPAAQEVKRVLDESSRSWQLQPNRGPAQRFEFDTQLAGRLRQVADRYPRFLVLQVDVAQRYLRLNKPEDAAAIASRAMAAFPNAAEPAQLAASISARLERWPETLLAAQEWRKRSLEQPLGADLAIAQAYVQLKDPRQRRQATPALHRRSPAEPR